MPIYTLIRIMRSREDAGGPVDDMQTVEARDQEEAIAIAQAAAAEPDSALLAIELRDEREVLIWSLKRGETISRRPGD